jgi:hypothetical protein
MPKSTATCNSLLALIFNGTQWTDIAKNDDTPFANLYVSLHTGDPGVGNNQTTNEVDAGAAYTTYARQAVTRDTGGWVAPSGAATSNTALIQFATCAGTGATLTYVAIGTASSGAGTVLYAGALSSPLVVAAGIQPQFAAGALDVTEA